MNDIVRAMLKQQHINAGRKSSVCAHTREDRGCKRYCVYTAPDERWPIYIYVFDEARWYGLKHNDAILREVRMPLVENCPVPTNMVTWQSGVVMSDIARVGIAGAVKRRLERAAR